MTKSLLMDFTVDKENKSIAIKKEFAAELARVWDAFTKSELLDQWWAPKPWKARTKSMDFREGGYWLYAMVGPNGEEHWAKVIYQSIQDKKRLKTLDVFTDIEGIVNNDMPKSEWDCIFTSKDGLSLVTIRLSFADLAHLEAMVKMGFKEGMAMALQNLDELFATKKP